MRDKRYRKLTDAEIGSLKTSRCSAEDWGCILVGDGFNPARVADVVFWGQVRIGRLDGEIAASDGLKRQARISRANLADVSLGDNCAVSNVHGWLANLDIEDGVVIENVGTIACNGETSFGNGTEVAVLNEGGGRELKITAETSAQIAYLTVMYRDRPDLVKALGVLADRFAAGLKSHRAWIGSGASITNTNEIVNVRIGKACVIAGALSLREGTIESEPGAVTTVGSGVIAEHFILQKGASVKDGAMVSSTLVGEAARLGKQFSSENCVFFANSEGFHSEACSLFGGPYTVTHHRSTLLIAAALSFYNAGSGTNQSNHMYKLGPVHQGILERGCKTGSFSYLLWPSRVGPFTAVMGKHYANFDTSDFPFSYVDDDHGKSALVPGMNFFTVGTLRDGEKWPARDRRKWEKKLDLIVFDVLSPYTAQKMIRGRDILNNLQQTTDKSQELVTWQGIQIKRLLLKTCSRYYKLAIDKYFGDVLVARLEKAVGRDSSGILKADGKGVDGESEWVDVCGLLCAKPRLETLIGDVVGGKIQTLAGLQSAFQAIFDAYKADEWNWVLAAYRKLTGKALAEGRREVVDNWKESSVKLINMVLNDASKEFDEGARIGFGIDGNRDADFEAVRGTFEKDKFVRKLKADAERVNKRYEAVLGLTA